LDAKRGIDADEIVHVTGTLLSPKDHVYKRQNFQFFSNKTSSSIEMDTIEINDVLFNILLISGFWNVTTVDKHFKAQPHDQVKKYLENAQVSTLLYGKVEFIKKPIAGFIRLRTARMFQNVAEVCLPSLISHRICSSVFAVKYNSIYIAH